MRRWMEVVLVLAVVAAAVRLWLPSQASQPAPLSVPPPAPGPAPAAQIGDPLGGYTAAATSLLCNGRTLLSAGASREKVQKVLGKPVGFNSDDSMWGYWTRNLPNHKMGILIGFDRDGNVQ